MDIKRPVLGGNQQAKRVILEARFLQAVRIGESKQDQMLGLQTGHQQLTTEESKIKQLRVDWSLVIGDC